MSSEEKRSRGYILRSLAVALFLAVVTVIELFAAIRLPNGVVILLLLALFKGVAVLYYYMHVSRLWTQEGEH